MMIQKLLLVAGLTLSFSASSVAQPKALEVRSSAFASGQAMGSEFAASGQNQSPPLSWSGVPAAAQELVLLVDDPDAAPFNQGKTFTHWVVYGIPPSTRELPTGLPRKEMLTEPVRLKQGKNSAGKIGYTGPYPPRGSGAHHYHFQLYALDSRLDLKPGLSRQEVLDALRGHVLAQGELVGLYEVKK